MKATITDVAKRAGVSIKTVSRVLNNEPNVAEKTRQKVRAIANELRYSPNLAARSLATSKSYLLALVHDNPSPYYVAHIQRGAIEACREGGYHLVVEPLLIASMKSSEEKANAIRSVLDRLTVDGVILTPPLCDSETILQILAELRIKSVRVSPKKRGLQPFVGMDDETAAYQMTQYLLKQGHRRIAFIRGHIEHASTYCRQDGYDRAIREVGIEIPDNLKLQGDYSFDSGVKAARKILGLQSEDRPTAVFASNDDMAAGVISVAGKMGVSVPKTLSVCGFDDTPLARVIWPALTTVRQPIYKMGYQAAKKLIRQASAGEDIGQILDFEIIVRDSVISI